VAITLSLLFAFYGFVRKRLTVGSIPGLMIEVLLLAIPALTFLLYLESRGTAHFRHDDTVTTILLVATGPLTAIPLILFAEAVRRLRLVTTGLLFYLTPSIQFLIGALLYGEQVSAFKLSTFILIWIALAIFAGDAIRSDQTNSRISTK
jgi:chloramphenicol-sensitive protein RarD